MNPGGDAAEQVVRMTLEGTEVAVRIVGSGAKNLAILLAAVLREETKTKGKARLSSMIRSGKELKVFTIRQMDLKVFAQEAKRYGVLYSALTAKNAHDPLGTVDVIARAEDAAKIQRIIERFRLATVDGKVSPDMELTYETDAVSEEKRQDARGKRIMRDPEEEKKENPAAARMESGRQFAPDLTLESRSDGSTSKSSAKPSVREKLIAYRKKKQEVMVVLPNTRAESALEKALKAKEQER